MSPLSKQILLWLRALCGGSKFWNLWHSRALPKSKLGLLHFRSLQEISWHLWNLAGLLPLELKAFILSFLVLRFCLLNSATYRPSIQKIPQLCVGNLEETHLQKYKSAFSHKHTLVHLNWRLLWWEFYCDCDRYCFCVD